MKKTLVDYIKRGCFDELYTPEYAITPLLKYLPKDAIIWECTDFGDSNITKVLRKNGFKVVNTNKTEIDFLKDDIDFNFDIIITNPPYSLKNQFIRKCYEYKTPFCLLLPITSLEGIERGKMYRKNGIELLVLDKRIDFNGKGKNWFNTSWFCWKVLPKQLIFKELIKANKMNELEGDNNEKEKKEI